MNLAEQFLTELGVNTHNKRHLGYVEDFLNDVTDYNLPELLNKLGSWDQTDYTKAKTWLEKRELKPALLAKNIVEYFRAYRAYMNDNSLNDDSETITVEGIINFVHMQFSVADLQNYKVPYFGNGSEEIVRK